MRHWRVMESPELSLGPSGLAGESADGCSPMLAVNRCRKRKFPWDHLKSDHPMIQSGFQLQPKKPLDWEQCLDFEVSLSPSFSHISHHLTRLFLIHTTRLYVIVIVVLSHGSGVGFYCVLLKRQVKNSI